MGKTYSRWSYSLRSSQRPRAVKVKTRWRILITEEKFNSYNFPSKHPSSFFPEKIPSNVFFHFSIHSQLVSHLHAFLCRFSSKKDASKSWHRIQAECKILLQVSSFQFPPADAFEKHVVQVSYSYRKIYRLF